MSITALSESDTSAICRVISKDRHDAIIFATDFIDTDLTPVSKAILQEHPDTNIILVNPSMIFNIVDRNEDMKKDVAEAGNQEMIVFCRDGYVRDHIMLGKLPSITDEGSIQQIVDIVRTKLPDLSHGPSDPDDKLARIRELRSYVCRRYPESCCAYNKAATTYYDLVNEVANDFIYMVIGLCGCGCPDSTIEAIRDYLEIVRIRHTKDDGGFDRACAIMQEKFHHNYVCDDSLLQFMAYLLDDKGLTEHGSSINGAWLTDEGEVCLEVLNMYLGLDDEEEE